MQLEFSSSTATTPEAHQTLNLLIGFGIAGSGFGQFSSSWKSPSQKKDL